MDMARGATFCRQYPHIKKKNAWMVQSPDPEETVEAKAYWDEHDATPVLLRCREITATAMRSAPLASSSLSSSSSSSSFPSHGHNVSFCFIAGAHGIITESFNAILWIPPPVRIRFIFFLLFALFTGGEASAL